MWQIRRDKYDFTHRKNSVPRILNKNEKVEGCDMGDEYFLYDHVPVIFWWLRRHKYFFFTELDNFSILTDDHSSRPSDRQTSNAYSNFSNEQNRHDLLQMVKNFSSQRFIFDDQ